MKSFDLGFHCDYLLTMAGGRVEVARDRFLGVTGSQITEIAPWGDGKWKATQLIHAPNRVVMPSLINGHTHLPMTLLKGLADDLPFAEWLHNYIIPLEQKMVDSEFVKTGTELAALELIRSGVTTVCDMYYFEDSVAEVLDRVGMRGLVGEAISDFPGPDNKVSPDHNWKILEKMREKYKNHPRITPCYAPHAPYTCSDETLKKVRKAADRHPLPIIIHVAETLFEVEESLRLHKKTPVSRLKDLGIMGENTIFAHSVHVSDADIELIARTNTGVIYNPESNMKLGSGVAPVPKMLQHGVRVGIGTDGSASNNDLSIFREMDVGVKLQKLTHKSNTAMTAKQVLNLATWGGARALGLGAQTGSLEVGKKADILVMNLELPHLQPIHDIASQLVYSATGQEVETVVCDGRVLLHEGKFTSSDPQRVIERARQYQGQVKEVLGGSN